MSAQKFMVMFALQINKRNGELLGAAVSVGSGLGMTADVDGGGLF